MMFEIELELARKAAREAGIYLCDCYLREIELENGRDIKLIADKESERIIISILSESGYSILSEEKGLIDKGTDYCWIVDPLDGSMNYSRGMDDLSCVSISLFFEDKPVLGVIYRYSTDELFEGTVNSGAYLNGKAIMSSDVESLNRAVIGTGFPVRTDYSDTALADFCKNVQRFKKVRMLGAAAIMAVFVACGSIDVYCEENVMLWDIAAAVAIVEAAGGICELRILEDNKCVCRCFANRRLQEEFYRS